MRSRSERRIAPPVLPALAAVLVLMASAAGAETQLLAGKRLALRQSPRSERLIVVSQDHLVAPLPGGGDDPTLMGATLEIGNPATGEWARFTIPAGGWSLNALGTVFRYGHGHPQVAGAVRELVIRHDKRLKVKATAVGLTLDERAQGGLAVVLTTGSRRYCMLFGSSSVKRDQPRRFAARNAPAPTTCPTPPAGTSTTSTSVPHTVATTTSTTRTTRPPSASTSTSTSSSSTRPSTTVTTSSTSSSSSTRPPSTTTTSNRPPTTIRSTTTSSSTSTSAPMSSTTTTIHYTCGDFTLFCAGTCPPRARCVGGLIRPCHCQVVD